jgi:hypothetical protein
MAKKMTGAAALLAHIIDESIREYSRRDEREPYIRPSSLAKGCLKYIAFELMEMPKKEFEPRVSRILQVGTDSHRRIQRYLKRTCLTQEVWFEVPEYRIHGYCDGIVYLSPEQAGDEAGFYALEIKTTGASGFERIVATREPKEDHVRQLNIYIWGLGKHYGDIIPFRGGLILYENRDTLAHYVCQTIYDEETVYDLMARIKVMLERLERGLPPEDWLPRDHWAHGYCSYLSICEPGLAAVEWQKKQPKDLPDEVLAGIIGKRILAKQRSEGRGKKKQGKHTLAELSSTLGWE